VVYFTGILAAAFLLVGGFLAGKLTLWLGADQAVFWMTETYLRVILFFAPAFMLIISFLLLDKSQLILFGYSSKIQKLL